MNQRPRTWVLVCLIGLAVSGLLIGVSLSLKRKASRQKVVRTYTPLTGNAEWRGDWEVSEQGADPSQAGSIAGDDLVIISFEGNELALQVRRGGYRAYLWVSVDGAPANQLPRTQRGAYLVLSSPDYQPQVTTIPVASGLRDGPHTAEIVTDRGWNQWPLAGWRVTKGPDTLGYDRTIQGLAAVAVAFAVGLIGSGTRWAKQRRIPGQEVTTSIPVPSILPSGFPLRLLRSPAWFALAAGTFYVSRWPPLTLVSGLALSATILLRIDLGLALVMYSAPFYLHPRPLLGKSFSIAEIATLLCGVSWGIRQLRSLPSRLTIPFLRSLSPADVGILLLILTAATSTIFADYSHVALRELRVVILEPALFYLMLRTSKLREKDVSRITDAFVLGAVTVALIGIAQYVLGLNIITAEQGFRRLRSVYGSPNNAALYMGRALPMLIAVAIFAEERWRRLVYGVLVAPVALAILLSFSRAAILLGVPATLLLLGVLAGGRWRWVALGLVGAAVLIVIPLMSTPRFAGLLDPSTGTLFFRVQLWRSSWKMFLDHLYLGVGPDNFLYQYRGRYILPSAWQEPHLSHAHNILLTYATRLGLPGLTAGILLQVSFWRRVLTRIPKLQGTRRAAALGLAGSMAYSLAHGLVDASHFFVDLAFASHLTLGLVQWLPRRNSHGQEE